jgi:sn-glycerol 3-phosphate transport system ATP-binding protein
VSEGEVKIGGNRVNELEPMDRDIAMVFQNYALYPHMSVRENMGYGLKIAVVSPQIRDIFGLVA